MKEPAFVAFFCAKGEDIVFEGTHVKGENDPEPVDISTWHIRVKAQRKDGTVIVDVDGTITDGANGKYTWPITHAVSNVATGLLTLDIFRTDVGFERAMVIGTLKIGKDVRYGA